MTNGLTIRSLTFLFNYAGQQMHNMTWTINQGNLLKFDSYLLTMKERRRNCSQRQRSRLRVDLAGQSRACTQPLVL